MRIHVKDCSPEALHAAFDHRDIRGHCEVRPCGVEVGCRTVTIVEERTERDRRDHR